MPRNKKMSESEIVALIDSKLDSLWTDGFNQIAQERIESNFANSNLHTQNTRPNTKMSKVNFYFTPMATKTLTMHQSKIFCSDKKTAEFIPMEMTEEASMAAKQLSKAVDCVLHRKNPGFEILTELFRSSAVNKNAIAKFGWMEDREIQEVEMMDLDPLSIQDYIDDYEAQGWDVTIKKEKEKTEVSYEMQVDPLTGEAVEIDQEVTLVDVSLRLERDKGKIYVEAIPPEEFHINEDTTSINNDILTNFVAHSKEILRTDVGMMFPDIDAENLASDSLYDLYEKRARHWIDGTQDLAYTTPGASANGAEDDKLLLVESWVRADKDGDGYAEWLHCFTVGQEMLSCEEWFGPLPFSSFTFFPIAHKFYGQSVYDLLKGYDETATGLFRSEVDMNRLKNTFRMFAKTGTVDRRMLESGRPGIIPVSNTFDPADVMVVPQPQGNANIKQDMDEVRMQVAGEIGIDPISGSVSSKIEDSGNDAEKTQMAISNAEIKVEGYARRFAEGPLRDICWGIAYLLVKYKDEPFVQEVINSVTPGEPFYAAEKGLTNILDKTDFVSKVGLGHQTGHQKITASRSLIELVGMLEQNPSKAIYNLVAETFRGWGYENPEEMIGPLDFWKQKRAQMDQEKQQAMQMEQQRLKLDQDKFQAEMQARGQQFAHQQQIDNNESEGKIAKDLAQAAKAQAEAEVTPRKQDLAEADLAASLEKDSVVGVI